jgi:hypothetical protein
MAQKTAAEILAARPDDEQGYQDDDGFAVDEVVGVLQIPIIRCHTKGKPNPVERVAILDEQGDLRVHDYVAVRRVAGHEVAGDVWMLGQAGVARIVAILAGQLAPLPGLLGKLLMDALNKGIGKL